MRPSANEAGAVGGRGRGDEGGRRASQGDGAKRLAASTSAKRACTSAMPRRMPNCSLSNHPSPAASSRCRCQAQHRRCRPFGNSISSSSCTSCQPPAGQRFPDFAHSSRLRHAQLHGVFLSITPGDPSLWVGVIFVRKGRVVHRAKRPSCAFLSVQIGRIHA